MVMDSGEVSGLVAAHAANAQASTLLRNLLALVAEHRDVLKPEHLKRIASLPAELGLPGGVQRTGVHEDGYRVLYERLTKDSLDLQQAAALEPPPWLVEEVLYVDGLSFLYGAPGAGKSFLALDLALSVAHAGVARWGGQFIATHGPVLYVAAERSAHLGRRVQAWLEHHAEHVKADESYEVRFVPFPVHLAQRWVGEALGDYAGEMGAVSIIVDTLARCIPGVEENSAKEMGPVLDHLEQARTMTRSATVVVHHTGVEGKKARGSTSMPGAYETGLLVGKSGEFVKVSVDKANHGLGGRTLDFRLTPSADSVVPVLATDVDRKPTEPRFWSEALDALRAIATGDGVTAKTWEDTFRERTGKGRSSFWEAKKWLTEKGIVEEGGRAHGSSLLRPAAEWSGQP